MVTRSKTRSKTRAKTRSNVAALSGGGSLSLRGVVTASDYSVTEGDTVTLSFEDTSIAGVVTASDYSVTEGDTVTLEFDSVTNTYQWIDENGDNLSGETTNETDWGASLTEQPPRIRVTNPTSGKSKIFTVDSPIAVAEAPPGPPSVLTEAWIPSGYLKAGDVPATLGSTPTKWIGAKLGTVLTAHGSFKMQLINGVLIAVPQVDDAYWELPSDFALGNSRNLSVYEHISATGLMGAGFYFGLGPSASRIFEAGHYQRIDTQAYDGVTQAYNAISALTSPTTFGIRSGPSNKKFFQNANQLSSAAWASNTITGGCFGALNDGSVQLVARWFGIGVAPLLSDVDHQTVLDYFQTIATSPSDTAPALNIAAYGDSQTEGTNANGVSWAFKLVDNDGARLLPVCRSAGYFGVGGGEATLAANTAQLALNYLPSATRQLIIIAFTNDLDQGVGAGAAHMARVKAFGQARQGEGWPVAVCKLPNRVTYTAYNVEVAAFNALCDSDPWMDFAPDLATALNGVSGALNGDNIHWSEAGQELVYQEIKTECGI